LEGLIAQQPSYANVTPVQKPMMGVMSDSTEDAVADLKPSVLANDKQSFVLPARYAHWVDSGVAPWRRYGARMLDIFVCGSIAWIFIGFLWYLVAPVSADAFFAIFDRPAGRFVDLVLTTMVAATLNALLLAFVGNTLGKVIFGIKILNHDGSRPGLVAFLAREIQVWIWGLGLGIPFLSLVAMLHAFTGLDEKNPTSWDRNRFRVIQRKSNGWQIALSLFGVACIIATKVGTSYLMTIE
jgi:uncharacterized RDD family membrane protein YckC